MEEDKIPLLDSVDAKLQAEYYRVTEDFNLIDSYYNVLKGQNDFKNK